MESFFAISIKTQLKAEQSFSYSGYSDNKLAILGAFLKDYDSFRVAISRVIANGAQTSGSNRASSIGAYFSSNPYSVQDGLQKIAYFISKARFFCANDVVNSSSNDGSFEVPSTGAARAPYDSIGDYNVANNIYTALMASGQNDPMLLNWVVANLTGQRDVDFFQPAFDVSPITTMTSVQPIKQLSLSYMPVIINQVGSPFSIALSSDNSTFTLVNSTNSTSTTAQTTPPITMRLGSVFAVTVTVSYQDIWLAANTTTTGMYTSYNLCQSAWLVTVQYSSTVKSYLAFWYASTGFYLQNGASLQTSGTTAIVASNWSMINYTNAYIQATSQQFLPQTLYASFASSYQTTPQPSSPWTVPVGKIVNFEICSPGGFGGNAIATQNGFGGGSGAYAKGAFAKNETGVFTLSIGNTIVLASLDAKISVSEGGGGVDGNETSMLYESGAAGTVVNTSTTSIVELSSNGNPGSSVSVSGGASVHAPFGTGGNGGTTLSPQGQNGQNGFIFVYLT